MRALRVPKEVLLLRVLVRNPGSRQSSSAQARSSERDPRSGRASVARGSL